MKLNVHAGHNPAGKIACGASDLLDESTEARKIVKYLIKYLKKKGHTVYNCTVNNGASQKDVLKKNVTMCNKHQVDLDISIHLNSGRNDRKGDNKVGGCEVLVTADTGIKKVAAKGVRREMSRIGFTDRGTKVSNGLYFLNNTKAKAILVEVCFVDDLDDYKLYSKVGAKEIAKAIANGIA